MGAQRQRDRRGSAEYHGPLVILQQGKNWFGIDGRGVDFMVLCSSRIQETATSKLPGGRTPLNRTGTSKKVQSPTTAVNSPRVQSGVSSKVGQQMKKTNVTTNRWVIVFRIEPTLIDELLLNDSN